MLSALSDAQEAAASDFSIDDYGAGGRVGSYQIMQPAYPAPQWLGTYVDLNKALRECQTLCTLQGKPFSLVRWGREGSGNKGGVPCAACRPSRPDPRFPRAKACKSCSGLQAAPVPKPIATFKPNGERIVYDNSGAARVIGRPDYVVSRTPFPRLYDPRPATMEYQEAVATGQALANMRNKRAFICSSFGANCRGKVGTPVVYVDPGGLAKRYPNDEGGNVVVHPISEQYFQELVAEGRGRTYLGQGS
jgi:hypothetical protein